MTLSGGVLTVAEAEVLSAQPITASAVEGRVNFGSAQDQNFGIATDLSIQANNSWAIFSAENTTDTLFASLNQNGATQEVSLGALPRGFHIYQIHVISRQVEFRVDGGHSCVDHTVFRFTAPRNLAISAFYGASQPALQVDWARVESYASSGTFTSSVLDIGRTAVWGDLSWTADVPTSTTLTV